ncbi:hypothetical protein B0H19DRAFT_1262905 [Mycena capillaripes]|nr:hypothetical protein B0H19DRAFT_1262905 [Mycena capillaripes]
MFTPSSDINISPLASSSHQPSVDSFGHRTNEACRETIHCAHHSPHSGSGSPTEHLSSTYIPRLLRPLLDFFRPPNSLPSSPREISPLTPDAHGPQTRHENSTAGPHTCGCFSLPIVRLLSDSSRAPSDPADVCDHCHNEHPCSLPTSHALAWCACPNDHRFEQQTTTSAFHSLYCHGCQRYCYKCPGPTHV